MIEVNLLPNVKQEFVRTQRLKRTIISFAILSMIIAGAVVALLLFWLLAVQAGRDLVVSGDIKSRSATLKNNKNLTRDLTIQSQLSSITTLHESKGDLSRLFEYLKILNPQEPNNVSISKATIDTAANTINLEASAKDFRAIGVFRDTLLAAKIGYKAEDSQDVEKKQLFSTVFVTEPGVGKDSKGAQIASFKAQLTYDPDTFKWGITKPSVTVPQENTTPSAYRVSIFSVQPSTDPAAVGGAQ